MPKVAEAIHYTPVNICWKSFQNCLFYFFLFKILWFLYIIYPLLFLHYFKGVISFTFFIILLFLHRVLLVSTYNQSTEIICTSHALKSLIDINIPYRWMHCM